VIEVPVLTDKAKISKWNDICISMNWAQKGELDKWLLVHGILFTPGESCWGQSLSSVKVEDPITAAQIAKSTTGEALATHVLQALTGIMLFTSTEIETVFWQSTIERMSLEWELFLPPEIIPKMVRESIGYPRDTSEPPAPESPPEIIS
jgi:hypothetical protein